MRGVILSAIGAISLFAVTTQAATIAYWRFEEGTNGNAVPHSGGDGAYDGTIIDSSGNGNHLSPYNDSWAGFHYTNITPGATVPQTGATNGLAIQNNNGYPAANGNPAGPMTSMTPSTWTIEASYKPENSGSWRTILGRDAMGLAGVGDGNVAALYFQITPWNAFRVQYVDVTGVVHAAETAAVITNGFTFPNAANGQFYNLAAVNDGTNLTLLIDGAVAATAALNASANTAMSNGSSGIPSGGGWVAGEWTLGRGLYAGNHGDRAYGLLDEVRISDSALSSSQLLAVVPEPTSIAAIGLLGATLLRRRRNA